MKVKAVRLYGKKDLRFEAFEMREIKEDEILAKVVTDSLCMSSYKAMLQGSDHRAIPDDIDQNPIIMGHELCAEIVQVGEKLAAQYKPGDVFTVQAKMYFGDTITSPGYSYPLYGGNSTYIVIPSEVIRDGYILPYHGGGYYKASVAEPFSCIVSAFESNYHLAENHKTIIQGLKSNGNMAILAGCGPMGLGAVELAMSIENRPSRIVVTDIDQAKLDNAQRVLTPKNGVELIFVNTGKMDNPIDYLRRLSDDKGFDDILIMAPVRQVIETADKIAGTDSCLNFFAGPTTKDFYANINFYDVHYNYKHIIGTSGGDIEDMRAALKLIENGVVNPAVVISHIGGLDSAAEATLNLPTLAGAKKLIYCNIEMALTAIEDFEEKGKTDPIFAKLHEICARHHMLWNEEAENYLLMNGKSI